MAKIFNLQQIKEVVDIDDALRVVQEGFVIYSEGKVVVPSVGHLNFSEPSGNVHIKYGYIEGEEYYVIKIASGFYENTKLNLPSSNGLMCVFHQKTGQLASILLDEGYLTDLRTGAAGAVAAKFLAPKKVHQIGVIGTGTQARFQLQCLKHVLDCRDVLAWGRSQDKLDRLKQDIAPFGFNLRSTLDIDKIALSCNLIVTTTPARSPLLYAHHIKPGTHITAIGADSAGKQELDAEIFQKADLVVADKISQCMDHGDIHHAIKAKLLDERNIVELGTVIADPRWRRNSDDQITVADLTGVAIQDIQIAKLVHKAMLTS